MNFDVQTRIFATLAIIGLLVAGFATSTKQHFTTRWSNAMQDIAETSAPMQQHLQLSRAVLRARTLAAGDR